MYNTHSDEGLIPLYSFGPIAAVISLLSAVLTAFTSVLAPFAGESAAGIAVVLLTVCVRVLLVPVGVLQGTVTLLAKAVQPVVTAQALSNLSLTGSILIFCVGINLLWEKKLKVANMLPSILIAVLCAFVGV